MRKHLCVLAALAALTGCAGDPFKPNAVISDVEPNFIATGRTKQVEIHGDFTKWKDSSIDVADISFGDGITVDAVTVANASFLLVTITAATDAAFGPRDVEVDGESFNGAFFVNPPFEVLTSSLVQGDFAVLDIVGYDTDWLEGRTQVVVDEGDIHTDGSDFNGSTFVSVVGPTFIQAFVQADAFAAPGPRTLTINGLTTTDTLPDALNVEAASFVTLTAGNNLLTLPNAGGTSMKLRIPAGAADSVQQLLITAGTADPIALIYDPDLGTEVPFAAIGDESVFGVSAEHRLHNFAAGKDLFAWVWDANWLDDAFFGDIVTEGDDLSADLRYAAYAGSALTATVAVTDQTIVSKGGLAVYRVTASNRWNLVTVDVTTPDGGATIDGLLGAAREGTAQAVPVEAPADASGSGGDETLVYLAGGGLDAQVVFEDVFADAIGADSEHDVVFTEAAVPGTLYTRNDIALAIPEEGQVSDSLTVTGGATTITAVHVLVDLDHSYRGDLVLELESPNGTIVELYSGQFFDGRDGLIEAFPDTLAETGDLFDFAAEDANGTWTLRILDGLAPDAGVVRGWALAIEGT